MLLAKLLFRYLAPWLLKRFVQKSMKEFGILCSPIKVNEKMEVVDGQGRLAALKELGAPVYSYIIPGASARECAGENCASTNWTTSDYIKSHAALGNENYVRLRTLIERHPKLRERDLIGLASTPVNFGTGFYVKTVRNGKLLLSPEKYQWSDQVASRYEPFYEMLKRINCDLYWVGPAVLFAVMQEDLDRRRLFTILERSKSIRTNGNLHSALESVSEIYNYRLKSGAIDLVDRYERLKHDNGVRDGQARYAYRG